MKILFDLICMEVNVFVPQFIKTPKWRRAASQRPLINPGLTQNVEQSGGWERKAKAMKAKKATRRCIKGG